MSLIRPFLTQSLQVLFERGPPLLELRHRQRQQLLGRERRQRGRPRAARRGRGRGGEGQLAAQLFVEGVELPEAEDAMPHAVDVDVIRLEGQRGKFGFINYRCVVNNLTSSTDYTY